MAAATTGYRVRTAVDRKVSPVGGGVFLLVVGAILALAVNDEVPGVNIHVVGLILMAAGAGVIAHARHGDRHERVVRRVEEPLEPGDSPHVVEEVVREVDRH